MRRLWLPRLRRRPNASEFFDSSGAIVDGDLGGAVFAIVVLIVLGVLIFLLLPYIFFALELLVLPALFLYRIVFRKPWTVQAVATAPEREVRRWKVVGWRRSGEVVHEIASSLERGMGATAPPDARPAG